MPYTWWILMMNEPDSNYTIYYFIILKDQFALTQTKAQKREIQTVLLYYIIKYMNIIVSNHNV